MSTRRRNKNHDLTELGGRIAALRKHRGLTQADVAEIIGQEKQSVSQYETGRRTPDTATIQRITEALGGSFEWVATGKGDSGLWPDAGNMYGPVAASIAREHNVYEPPPVIEADLREVGRHVDYVVRDAAGRIRLRVSFLIEASPSAHESRVEHS